MGTGDSIESKSVMLKAKNREEAGRKALNKIGWSDSEKSWTKKEVEAIYCKM